MRFQEIFSLQEYIPFMLPNLFVMLKSIYNLNCVYPILLYHISHITFGFRAIPNSALHTVWKYLISGEMTVKHFAITCA